jgi:hypothetical protein
MTTPPQSPILPVNSKWSIEITQLTLPESIAWGFRGERRQATEESKLVVVAATVTAKSPNADERKMESEKVFITSKSSSKGMYLAIADGPDPEKGSFIPPEAVMSADGEMMMSNRKGGETFGVGKKAAIPYIKFGEGPVQVLLAFSLGKPDSGDFVLHFGEISIKACR